MTASNSTDQPKPAKPNKPYRDFPLFAHASGRWCKKIRGKFYYFGKWDDPDGALRKYLDQRDDLYAGRTPRVDGAGLTIKELANRFLTAKRRLVDSGELTERSWRDYHTTCGRIVAAFGLNRLVSDLAADDFERFRASLAQNWGPTTLSNEIQRIRVVFKYGYDAGLIDQPMRYGPCFQRPSKRTLRLHKAANGPLMFKAEEILRMVAAASVPLRAMIFLGVNGGLGNTDCGLLPESALDLEGGWLTYPRPKTGISRRIPLWVETVEALKAASANRPEPKNSAHAGLVFVTQLGGCWAKSVCENPISKEMAKLLKRLGINGRKGLGFYTLRHVFETIGGEARDQVAVDAIMGHADSSMAATYRESISDERLRAVTAYVRKWLFAQTQPE
jgi:integrase